jgi:DNA-binding response OmpR family regulator
MQWGDEDRLDGLQGFGVKVHYGGVREDVVCQERSMIYRFADYELDTQRRELRRAGQLVAIEPKVFEVLLYLLQHRERVVTKEELLAHCWQGTFVSDAALSRCLAKVRKAVQPDHAAPSIIKTVYGQGYCCIAPIATVDRAQPRPMTPAAGPQPPALPERSKILIVDDEPFNVDYLEQELADLGYETVSASNGQEALEKVAMEAPDLILLDVMMPVMDGFTVCRILKDHEATQLIPIVIMTALDAREDRIKGIKAGADDFLTKPVHEEELLARIATALKLKHTVDRKIGELRDLKDHFARFVRLVSTPDSPAS